MTTDNSTPDVAIELAGLQKSYGDVPVVRSVDLQVQPGEFFSLLGSSGCGKTTTLRMMAGFETPDCGSITMCGRDVTRLPPSRRPVNLVFQRYELFPHMTVFENIAFGLKVKKVPKSEIGPRVTEMLKVTGVEALESRKAEQLSGGQQQRVALARALVNRPEVLLLDEPLSALDAKLRRRMQLELKDIQSRLGTTFLYVTHDQEEALLMSDRIGIMNKGCLEQVGTPQEIYERPGTAFVADFIGAINTLELRVTEVDASGPRFADTHSVIGLPAGAELGATVTAVIRPERILIDARTQTADDSRLVGNVDVVTYVGSNTQYTIATAVGRVIVSTVTGVSSAAVGEGDRVTLSWPRAALRTIDAESTS